MSDCSGVLEDDFHFFHLALVDSNGLDAVISTTRNFNGASATIECCHSNLGTVGVDIH